MSRGWKGSQRKEELPKDWPAIRAEVLERDGERCTWKMHTGRRCSQKATDVDHVGDKHDHGTKGNRPNLRSLCAHHHLQHTAQQAGDAASARKARSNRPPEEHPGLIMRRPPK